MWSQRSRHFICIAMEGVSTFLTYYVHFVDRVIHHVSIDGNNKIFTDTNIVNFF